MKNLTTLLFVFTILFSISGNAQTADEIINTYIENIGGKEKLESIKGTRMSGNMKMQGIEIPIELLFTNEGKQLVTIEIQGNKTDLMGFDGEISWKRNMMNMKIEKNDNEATENLKKQAMEFPDPFLNYQKKGFSIELIGKETIDGTETFKIKLTKKPLLENGELKPNTVYYYFDTENFVPIATETIAKEGPTKGQMVKTTISDYQEVDGIYFPFSSQNSLQTIEFKKIELNPEVDPTVFALPKAK